MPLQLAIPRPDGLVAEHLLFAGNHYSVGRGEDADIVINHPQVSRCHALLHATNDDDWSLSDRSSTGCFIGNKQVFSLRLEQSQVLKFGPVACKITRMDRKRLVSQESEHFWRQSQISRYRKQLNHCDSSKELIATAQECLLQSLGCERAALILTSADGELQHSMGYQLWMDDNQFTGSRTIIRKAIAQHRPFALGHVQSDPLLSLQESIIRNNICAAICVPIFNEEELVAVLYGDNTCGRHYFTEPELELASSIGNLLSLRLLFHSIEHKLSLVRRS